MPNASHRFLLLFSVSLEICKVAVLFRKSQGAVWPDSTLHLELDASAASSAATHALEVPGVKNFVFSDVWRFKKVANLLSAVSSDSCGSCRLFMVVSRKQKREAQGEKFLFLKRGYNMLLEALRIFDPKAMPEPITPRDRTLQIRGLIHSVHWKSGFVWCYLWMRICSFLTVNHQFSFQERGDEILKLWGKSQSVRELRIHWLVSTCFNKSCTLPPMLVSMLFMFSYFSCVVFMFPIHQLDYLGRFMLCNWGTTSRLTGWPLSCQNVCWYPVFAAAA